MQLNAIDREMFNTIFNMYQNIKSWLQYKFPNLSCENLLGLIFSNKNSLFNEAPIILYPNDAVILSEEITNSTRLTQELLQLMEY